MEKKYLVTMKITRSMVHWGMRKNVDISCILSKCYSNLYIFLLPWRDNSFGDGPISIHYNMQKLYVKNEIVSYKNAMSMLALDSSVDCYIVWLLQAPAMVH